MTTLTVTDAHDFSGETLTNIDVIEFVLPPGALPVTPRFGSNQFGPGLISNTVAVDLNGTTSIIEVDLSAPGTLSAAGWTFSDAVAGARSVDIHGTGGADTLTGSSRADSLFGGAGADTLSGGGGDDRFDFDSASLPAAGESVDGGDGTDQLQILAAATLDFSTVALTSIEALRFGAGTESLTFAASQIGAGAIADIHGASGVNAIVVNGTSVNLSGVAFTAWTNGTDTIVINGTDAILNGLVGSSQNDTINGTGNSVDAIRGGGGADVLNAGGGSDFFFYDAAGDLVAGEVIAGGAGTDEIKLTSGGIYDFSAASISGVENLDFQSGDSGVTFSGTQLGSGAITGVNGGSGAETIIVNATSNVDLSGVTFSAWADGTDIIIINGTAAAETLIGSSHADLIVGGAGVDTLDGGNGNDVFRYTQGIQTGETVDGGLGTDALQLATGPTIVDFTQVTFTGIEALQFESGAGKFTDTQVRAGAIASITGSANSDRFDVSGASVDLSGLSFTSWSATDFIHIAGTPGSDSLVGSNQNEIFLETAGGVDASSGAGGDDEFRFTNVGAMPVGSSVNGGADFDVLAIFSGEADFSLATLSNFEKLRFDTFHSAGSAKLSNLQIGTGAITAVEGNFEDNALVVSGGGNIDLSAVTFTNWDLGVKSITLNGSGGTNTMTGTAFNDVIDGKASFDTMIGGLGDDQYFVDNALDAPTESAAQGNDRVFASLTYTLAAGQEIEKLTTIDNGATTAINLTGNEFANIIFGNAGANTLNGAGGTDTLLGLGGDDFYFVDNALDTVSEGAGEGANDRVFASVSYTLGASAQIEKLTTVDNAGTTAINLTGNGFANTIFGNAGANTLNGKAGADAMLGLGGDDLYFVDNALDTVSEGAGEGASDQVLASVSYTLGAGAQVELLSTDSSPGTAAINLTGNGFANIVIGNAGANTLDGKGAADVMFGGKGDDLYFVDNAADQVSEAAGEGIDRVLASASYALAAAQEIEKLTTDNNDATAAINLTGNEFANIIFGNAGFNELNGGGGADTLVGLGGSDRYFIDSAADTITEGASDGVADQVVASVSYTLGAGVHVETLTTNDAFATAAINLTGNEIVNQLFGNAGANTLDGKGGADRMTGFAGDDLYFVDSAADQVFESAGEGAGDRIFASVDYALIAGRSIEILSTTSTPGVTPINLTGNDLANTVIGNAGSNTLKGLAGNDTLFGGEGADGFVFDTALNAATNVDTIIEFSPPADDIILAGAIFTAITPGTLAAADFAIGAAAADASDRIIYNGATGALFYDADGAGGAAQVQFATLTAGLAVTNADFIVV